MSQNVYDFETKRPLEKLIAEIGLDECRRFGFIFEDERAVRALSTISSIN